jgi:RNA polymerase sigma-70 factor (ECF subfamily)
MEADSPRSRLEALHPESFGWALACCDRDAESAREVLQMTYLKVLDGRARWDGRAEFKTWLFAVIRNTAAEKRRREWLSATALARLWADRSSPVGTVNPEAAAVGSEAARLLRESLDRLSRRQREVLHLVFYHGLTLDDAAGVLGLAPGTARLHYDRGKRRLREMLPEGIRP